MQAFQRRALAQQAVAVVGVDAGKFKHAMVVRVRGQADSKPIVFPVTRPGFERAVESVLELVGEAGGPILVGIEFAGMYGFTWAHYLRALDPRFQVVSVLPAHTKRWKEVTHRQPLKTDAKDAVGITDLAAQGHFVSFPFLATGYAELRYLLSARERVATLRRALITRLHTSLDVVFPEFPTLFSSPVKKTARALLHEFPGPMALLEAPKRDVVRVLRRESRNHLGLDAYEEILDVARHSLALPSAQGAMRDEIPLLIERYELYDSQLKALEGAMARQLNQLGSGRALLTIPNVAPVSAAVFLGSIGDPQAYDSSRQVVARAGLTLVERSSGIHLGKQRISKRGRPVLRKHAHLFAVRSIQRGGLFRRDYEALLARNGGRAMSALTAIARKGLRLFFAVARSEAPWHPMPPSGAIDETAAS